MSIKNLKQIIKKKRKKFPFLSFVFVLLKLIKIIMSIILMGEYFNIFIQFFLNFVYIFAVDLKKNFDIFYPKLKKTLFVFK